MILGFLSIPKNYKDLKEKVTLVCESHGDDLSAWSVSNGGEHLADLTIDPRNLRGNDLRDRLTFALSRVCPSYLVLP